MRDQLYQLPNGIRASADYAFLSEDVMTKAGDGVGARKLKVSFHSTVTRVLFDGKRAIGVECLRDATC